jgi:hypothetical protein
MADLIPDDTDNNLRIGIWLHFFIDNWKKVEPHLTVTLQNIKYCEAALPLL